jgi:hypothetical protein
MRLAATLAALLALVACAGSSGLKYPEGRLVGQTASFGGCAFRVAFAGNARRLGSSADDLRQDYASSIKRSNVLDEEGFEASDGGTRELVLCRCMRTMQEASANSSEATNMLRASFRDLAGMSAAPVDWKDGTEMGRVQRFEFLLKDGRRVHAGTNFSDNCVGAVAAIGGSEAAAKRFVDSRAPL